MTQKNITLVITAIFSMISATAFGMQNLGQSSVYAPSKLGNVQIVHANKKFQVMHNGKTHDVQNAWVDKEIRCMKTKQLAKYLMHGNLLKINQADNGEFSIGAHARVNGGGAGGATIGFFAGKMAMSVVGHGTIALIAAGVGVFCPPAGVAVGIALESALAVPIEAASLTVGLATGILGSVASGPL